MGAPPAPGALKKRYILDTNVLLHDPNSLVSFQDNDVLLPIDVIEEIDHFKKAQNELGQNARAVSRFLDGKRKLGKLSEGVPLESGGVLRIVFNGHGSPPAYPGLPDNHILAAALRLREAQPQVPLILVTKDINLRIKADAMGLKAEDYEADRVRLTDLYTGEVELQVSEPQLQQFRERGELELGAEAFAPNEYVLLLGGGGRASSALARVDPQGGKLNRLVEVSSGVCGIRPRNKEQYYALDCLLDDRLHLVTLMGKAGTGKTLLALAAGLQRVLEARSYKRLLVSRPIFPLGKDIGYLPGSLEEKLTPWMQPLFDNIELLADRVQLGRRNASYRELLRSGVLAIEPLTYIRGRSIPHQYIIIDEAQNLTPLEVKTILTRVGHDSKIVLTGDPFQIDHPYVDSSSNGFNTVVNRFRCEPIAAHVNLLKGERSDLAELAANLL